MEVSARRAPPRRSISLCALSALVCLLNCAPPTAAEPTPVYSSTPDTLPSAGASPTTVDPPTVTAVLSPTTVATPSVTGPTFATGPRSIADPSLGSTDWVSLGPDAPNSKVDALAISPDWPSDPTLL